MQRWKWHLLVFVFSIVAAVSAYAGPGTVELMTKGDISMRLGAQVRFIPTWENDRDFGLSNVNNDFFNGNADCLGFLGPSLFKKDSTGRNKYRAISSRAHLTERGGSVKDDYIGTENRLFFNANRGDEWDFYMALEMDTVLSSTAVDRTDFVEGKQSQQFGIERLAVSAKIPSLYSRFWMGWDAKGVDIHTGGLVYGDDDPTIGLYGHKGKWKWDFGFIMKKEGEAGYFRGSSITNAIGEALKDFDADRWILRNNVAYKVFPNFTLEGFYVFEYNTYKVPGRIFRHFVGLQGYGQFGIVKPVFEIAYDWGDADGYNGSVKSVYDAVHGTSYFVNSHNDFDITAYALYGDVAFDLSKQVGLKQFEPHIGFYYVGGDSDPLDGKFSGFMAVTGIDRFSPRFGTEASIAFDGNPVLGQILYSMIPAQIGMVGACGGAITGTGNLDNPGLVMLGGGLKAKPTSWISYKGNVMFMWFQTVDGLNVALQSKGQKANINRFIGLEWNNELAFKFYHNITVKAQGAVLFPGAGAKDITAALDAIDRNVYPSQGTRCNDKSIRLALDLIWFF